MPDREKVIKGLKCLSALEKDRYVMVFCENCEYRTESYCTSIIASDALALLKEQQEEIENLKQTAQSMMEGLVVMRG